MSDDHIVGQFGVDRSSRIVKQVKETEVGAFQIKNPSLHGNSAQQSYRSDGNATRSDSTIERLQG